MLLLKLIHLFIPMENLPKYSHEQKLEKASLNRIRLILEDTDLFVVGANSNYDYGVDFNIELLSNSSNPTNFNINAQLKAIDFLEKNALKSDKSYSIQISSSNINYLLSGVSIYILYVNSKNCFYFKWADELFNELQKKKPNWLEKEAKHTINFNRKLDESALNEIHNIGLEKLKSLRNLRTEQTLLVNSTIKTSSKIVYDADTLSVSTDESLVQYLKKEGIGLINQGHSNYILKLAEEHTKNIEANDFIIFLLGFANFNIGNNYQALAYLQKIITSKKLTKLHRDYSNYLFLSIKNSLGQDTKEEMIKEFENSIPLSTYSKLKIEKEKFEQSPIEYFEKYLNILNEITSQTKDYPILNLQSKTDQLYARGWMKNHIQIRNTSNIEMMETMHEKILLDLREQNISELFELNEIWFDEAEKLRTEIISEKNPLIYANFIQIYCHTSIRHLIASDVVKISRKIHEHDEEKSDGGKIELLELINEAIEINKHYQNNYNLCVSLSTKFEILEFYSKIEEANDTLNEMIEIAKKMDFVDLAQKTKNLIKGNSFLNQLKETQKRVSEKQQELLKREEVAFQKFKEIHDKEQNIIDEGQDVISNDDSLIIEIFRIGFYCIEKPRLDEFFGLLNIEKDSDLAKKIRVMGFKLNAIPRLNIIPENILEEGYGEGNNSFKNIEDVERRTQRKLLLFENSFIRVKDFY